MSKIAIFLDHDIIIRHFVYTGVFEPLERIHDVVYFVPENHRRVTLKLNPGSNRKIGSIKIDENRAYLWRRLYQHEVLRRARRGDPKNKKHIYNFWRETLGNRPFWKTWLYSFQPFFFFYKRRILKKVGHQTPFDEALKEFGPDIIVHPTVLEGLFVSDLIQWGQAHQVPTIFLMNSWDNPATKAVLNGQPSLLAVWGEQTKKLAIQHLGFETNRICILGAAQFDHYRKAPKRTREQFISELGMDPEAKLLLYAGSSKGVNEVSHLQAIENAMETGRIPNGEILYRPHPWRGVVPGEPDFFSLSWKRVKMDPLMVEIYKKSRQQEKFISTPDLEYTHEILNACDLVISPISTILLEAAMHGKPILAYLPQEDIPKNFFLREMAAMNFFQEFFEKTGCGPYFQMEQLLQRTKEIMEKFGPQESHDLKEMTRYFVDQSGGSYTERLIIKMNELLKIQTGQ